MCGERTVDFERVDGKFVQVAERRVAGAKIVEIDLHAEVAKAVEHLRRLSRIVHERRFGDFEPQITWRDPSLQHRIFDEAHKALLHQLPRGYVDGDVVERGGRILPTPLRKLPT